MIHYVATRHWLSVMEWFVAEWAPELAPRVRCLEYGELFRARRIPRGAWIFADLERLAPAEQERAAAAWNALAAAGAGVRLLNHPIRSMRRYELLRSLFEAGTNAFDVCRLDEARRPERYPVFVRGERDHEGAQSGLLGSAEALEAEIARLSREGRSLDGRIAVELCAERDARGLYRKYSAFRIGPAIVPRHLFFGRDWLVKGIEVLDAGLAAEELAYVRENPHEAILRDAFARARIEYGRVDYGVVRGRVQVYEINTAPIIGDFGEDALQPLRRPVLELVPRRLAEAFRAVDVEGAGGAPVAVPRPRRRVEHYRIRTALQRLLRALGLRRLEPRIVLRVQDLRDALRARRARG